MKKWATHRLAVATTALALSMMASSVAANNQGFSVNGQSQETATQQPARYFVKYQTGKENEVRALLRSLRLEVVDALVKQQVLVVSGSQEQVDQLAQSEWIDYTEQEPIRELYRQ